MKTIEACDLKTHASELLDAAERGETITITRRGVPVAQLVPINRSTRGSADSVAQWKLRRRRIPKLSMAEIRSMHNEGRRAE